MNQVVFRPYFSNSFSRRRRPDLAREQAARDVVGRVLAAVGAEPAGDGVDVDADAQRISLAISSPPVSVGSKRLYDMCALCGVLLERALGRAGRRPARRASSASRSLNRVLDHFGLRLDDWGGRVYVLRDRKGRVGRRRRPRRRSGRRPSGSPAGRSTRSTRRSSRRLR